MFIRRGGPSRRALAGRRPRAPDQSDNRNGTDAASPSSSVEVGGSCLNLDLCVGAVNVLQRLNGVNPRAILKVSLEVNLMSELIFDQEWMRIFECIGSLPFLHTLSLSFRVPIPIPMQAFTKLIELATPLEHLNLVGLQLSATKMATWILLSAKSGKSNKRNGSEASPVEELIRAFQEASNLKNVHLSRYRPARSTSPSGSDQEADPLLRALSNLPHCKVFHLERTDIFAQEGQNPPRLLDLVCRAPFETLKIGPQDRSLKLENHLPKMAVPLNENPRLKELILHHNVDDNALEAMSQLLQHNQTLEKLSLLRIQSHNFGALLATALQCNTTLQSLELNVLSRDRAVLRQNFAALATYGNPQSGLVTLQVDVPGFRNSSSLATEALLKMLRHDNFVLQTIVINRNTVPLHKDILFYLKLNRIGRNNMLRQQRDRQHLYGLVGRQEETTRQESWAQTLIQNKDDIRVLHYFICRDPTILPVS